MWRGVERRFSISAPHMSVRPHIAWYLRWSMALPFVVAAIVLAWWAYDSGLEFAGFNRGQAQQELSRLRDQVAKLEMDNVGTQNRVFTAYDTETATQGYTLFNFAVGTDFVQKGKTIFSLHIALNNFTDVAYQNHLSRIKYAGENLVTGRTGVFNMGRNLSVKLNVPLDFEVKK